MMDFLQVFGNLVIEPFEQTHQFIELVRDLLRALGIDAVDHILIFLGGWHEEKGHLRFGERRQGRLRSYVKASLLLQSEKTFPRTPRIMNLEKKKLSQKEKPLFPSFQHESLDSSQRIQSDHCPMPKPLPNCPIKREP